jgi:hypothetical protein
MKHLGDLCLHTELEHAAHEWERAGRHDDRLVFGEWLDAAQRPSESESQWAKEPTALERDFLAASKHHEHRQETRRRLRRTLAAGLIALLFFGALVLVTLIAEHRHALERGVAVP